MSCFRLWQRWCPDFQTALQSIRDHIIHEAICRTSTLIPTSRAWDIVRSIWHMTKTFSLDAFGHFAVTRNLSQRLELRIPDLQLTFRFWFGQSLLPHGLKRKRATLNPVLGSKGGFLGANRTTQIQPTDGSVLNTARSFFGELLTCIEKGGLLRCWVRWGEGVRCISSFS